jgi:uncharacterized protein with FMN-binding domain
MNRILLSTAAAAAGVTGVLVLAPHLNPVTASATTSDGGTTSSGTTATGSSGESSGSSSSSGSSGSSGTSGSSSSSASGTFTGAVAQHQFGPVQVEITVQAGTITDISLVQLPTDGKSRFINSEAVPLLVSEALKAQSASIDGVSGATLTSEAFVTSLTSALSKAGL